MLLVLRFLVIARKASISSLLGKSVLIVVKSARWIAGSGIASFFGAPYRVAGRSGKIVAEAFIFRILSEVVAMSMFGILCHNVDYYTP